MRARMVLLLLALLAACDSERVFEVNINLESKKWHKDSVLVFDFEIEDPTIPYDIYYNIRNTASYPFYNLYLNHELTNSIGSVLSSDLDELFLFDKQTGKPLGRGIGDIFDHQILILDNYRFPSKGIYQLQTQQYMREDELPEVMAVGIRIEIADDTEG